MKKLLRGLFPQNRRNKNAERMIKAYFRNYFEPIEWEARESRKKFIFPISKLEITDISVKTTKKEGVVMTITLCRPGLLIGKGGEVIDSVTEYIQRRVPKPFKISIKESNLWR